MEAAVSLFADEVTPVTPWSGDPFKVVIADPPWQYQAANQHRDLTGYANYEYGTLDQAALEALPVGDVCARDAVLLLWTTWPFIPDALRLIETWGFTFKTGLPWLKATDITGGREPVFAPAYGVGYWLRGCSEPILLASRGNAAVRTNWVGLLSTNARHSRKPDTLYELAESFPGPYLELFARRQREGWVSLGNEVPGEWNGDVRETLPRLIG